jgi:tRNA dimethylallyltransferase
VLRAELEQLLRRSGVEGLAAELKRFDPATAQQIDINNPRRVIRAIEVYRVTGRPLSEWRTTRAPAFSSAIFGLACERTELYRRIDARVDAMMASGFLEEVRGLIDGGYTCDLPSMSSIGYRQLCQRTKTESHRLARTQNNWFRLTDSRIHWIDITVSHPMDETLRVVESVI